VDDDGWMMTGDIGFFDDDENIYIKERTSFMFKYFMFIVSTKNNYVQYNALQIYSSIYLDLSKNTNWLISIKSLTPHIV
jgi:hypothetical protein